MTIASFFKKGTVHYLLQRSRRIRNDITDKSVFRTDLRCEMACAKEEKIKWRKHHEKEIGINRIGGMDGGVAGNGLRQ